MISDAQYWMNRDVIYARELTPAIRTNAARTIAAVNAVLGVFAKDTGIILTQVSSGWRPACVNCRTANSAKNSLHMTAEACDMRDTPTRDFARWCCKNSEVLERAGLWLERFEWTPTWVHLQTRPPASGRRFYIPSSAPARCARLSEQDQFNC